MLGNWWDSLNQWRFGIFNRGKEQETETVKNLIPSFSRPKSLILPGLIIGGLAFFFLFAKKNA